MFAGVVQAAFDGAQGDAKEIGDFLLGELLPVAQAEDLLILGRELLQRVQDEALLHVGKTGHDGDVLGVR